MNDSAAALSVALSNLRAKNGLYVAWIRVAGVAMWLATNEIIHLVTGRLDVVATRGVIGSYFAVALVALLAMHSFPKLRGYAPALHWLADLPAIFWAQWVAMEHSTNPQVPAYLTATIYALLLIVGQLTARPAEALAEALMAVALFTTLVIHAGLHPVTAAGPSVTMLLITAVARYATRQLLSALDEVTRTEAMRERLSRYLSPSVRDAVMAAGVSSQSTRREVTVLMSDLRGFTSLAEKMDSEKLASELNEYFKAMVEVVFRHKGTLDKFIGDGMLVYFGAPLPNPDHAITAVQCALEMHTALDTLNQTRAARGDAPLKMGIGLNCGAVVVGDLGPPERVEYTIIGDTVNVTARMESLTKKFGVKVLASAEVQRRAAAVAKFLSMAPAEVSGKAEPLLTWAVEPA